MRALIFSTIGVTAGALALGLTPGYLVYMFHQLVSRARASRRRAR